MMKKEVMIVFGILLLSQFVSAGVGIKWDKESLVVNEGERNCLSYSVYNPWPEDSYVTIELSSPLKDVLVMQEAEQKNIPANTPSGSALPLQFCFQVPKVYKSECLVGGMLCKQECKETQVTYSGEILVKSIPNPTSSSGGAGGSAASMAVSAPLTLKVKCNAHEVNFTPLYLTIAIIALLIVIALVYRKYRKPTMLRDQEKLKKLQEKIKKEKQKK
jgi:hypothetical protein